MSKHSRWRRADWQALAASIVVHAGLGLIALFGLPQWTKPLPASPPVLTGTLVESPTAARKAREQAEEQAREEQRRQEREERERLARIEAEKQARLEAEKQARAEAARVEREKAEAQARKEAEQKAKAAADAKAREEAERKAEAERQAKAEAARKAKEEAARKAEAERKAKAEAERKARAAAEKKAREAALADALRAEQDDMDRTSWSSRLGAHIQKFWVRPAGANEEFSCIVRIRQSRYGDVLARSIVRTCGNDFLDNSVLEAVDEASPLPLPRNPRVFDEVVDIEFVPF